MGSWYWSTNEERWGCGPFESREDAIKNALDDHVDKFYTGKQVALSGKDFPIDADDILEQVGERAYELGGEASEGWPAAGEADRDELSKKLTEVLTAWIDEHDAPSFWIVGEVEEHARGE